MSSQLLRPQRISGENQLALGSEWHFTPNHNSSADSSTSVVTIAYEDSLSPTAPVGSLNQATAYESLGSFFNRHAVRGLCSSHCLRAYGFMFYFTPRWGFFSPLPSRYYFAIGHPGVFSLARWSLLIHTGFHVSHATRSERKLVMLSATGLSPSRGCSHFGSPLLRESLLLSFPLATKMFQFARLSLACPWIQQQFERLPYSGIPDLCLFSTPRSISSITTPFLVSGCLGIHRKAFPRLNLALIALIRLCHPKGAAKWMDLIQRP
ncbi:UNVERIFIED_CONTAM: hypothetical protein Sindi_0467700 [Sesamum indicum]